MNANEQLRDFNGSDDLYQHPFGLTFSEGVYALCERYQCWWFLDVMVSYQHELKKEEFQVWKLVKTDQSATVSCEDGNDKILRKQHIPFTDFPADEATVWVEFGTAILPSEH